jgi:hypothetical protein
MLDPGETWPLLSRLVAPDEPFRTEGRHLREGSKVPSFGVTEAALQGDGPCCPRHSGSAQSCAAQGSCPANPRFYCLFDGGQSEPEPVYVGETSRLSARAASHLAARWPTRDPWIAYRAFPGAPKHVLRELESDVLGWHFWRARAAPSRQYHAEHDRPDAG